MKQDTGKHRNLKKTHAPFHECRFMLHPTEWRVMVDHISGQGRMLRLKTLY